MSTNTDILVTVRGRDLGAADVLNNVGKSAEKSMASFASSVKQAGLVATTVLAGLAGGIGFGVKIAAELETARQGFVAILGSATEADKIIAKIKSDAATTPFEITGLTQANLKLTQVTKNAMQSENMLLNVGKALAFSGGGQAELDRVIANLQQIGNVGKITEMDIRQFGYANINILELLADYYGTTKAAASEMIKDSKDAFGDLEKAFEKAGTGSGKFSRAFIEQAGTFKQLMSNVNDSVAITASEIVKNTGIFDLLKKSMSELIDALNKLTPAMINFINYIKNNQAIVLAIAGAIGGLLLLAIGALITAFGSALLMMAGFAAVGAILGLWVGHIIESFKKAKESLAWWSDYVKNVAGPAIAEFGQGIKDKIQEAKNKWNESLEKMSAKFGEAKTAWDSNLEEVKIKWGEAMDAMGNKVDEFGTKWEASLTWWGEKFRNWSEAFKTMSAEQWGAAFGQTQADIDNWIVSSLVSFYTWKDSTQFAFQETSQNIIIAMGDWMIKTQESFVVWQENFKIGMAFWAEDTKKTIGFWALETNNTFLTWQENSWKSFESWRARSRTGFYNWRMDSYSAIAGFAEDSWLAIDKLEKNITAFVKGKMEEWRTGIPMVWNEIKNSVVRAIDSIKGAFRDLGSAIENTINKIKSFFDSAKSAREQGLHFATGGVVPGPIGAPVMATVHGGETITPAGRSVGGGGGTGGGVNFEVHIGLYAGSETEKRNIAKELYASLLQLATSQNKSVTEFMGG